MIRGLDTLYQSVNLLEKGKKISVAILPMFELAATKQKNFFNQHIVKFSCITFKVATITINEFSTMVLHLATI